MDEIAFDQLQIGVVEDVTGMRRLICSVLRSFGVKERNIFEADDGVSGLEMVETCKPDILITDWTMPNMSGADLVRVLRNPKYPNRTFIPILMLTANANRYCASVSQEIGVTEFLVKPFAPEVLKKRLTHMILNPRPFVNEDGYFGPEKRKSAIEKARQVTKPRISNHVEPVQEDDDREVYAV